MASGGVVLDDFGLDLSGHGLHPSTEHDFQELDDTFSIAMAYAQV
jgi:hypothetical protein